MTGYSPTVLELTPTPLNSAMPVLITLLTQQCVFVPAKGVAQRPDATRITGNLTIGNIRVEITARAIVAGSEEHLVLELDTSAYDAAYDLSKPKPNAAARQALIDFCCDVARAARAEGFLLRRDDEPMKPPSAPALARSLISTDGNWIIAGIELSSSLAPAIKDYWSHRAYERHGYLVLAI